MMLSSGRVIDMSCPFSGDCFANQGCWQECPETLLDVLRESAELEHELDLLPHTDPDLLEVCPLCKVRS
jgi:hypothetical protein